MASGLQRVTSMRGRSLIMRAVALGALVYLENRRPLRRRVAPRASRLARNLVLAAGSAAVVAWIETPLAHAAARAAERRRLGLIQALPLPPAARDVLGFVALDYTLYHWHRLTHHLPFLWRFHAAHHVDPDLDTSTGTAFHPAEMLLSVPFRLAQIVGLGVSPRALAAWKAVLLPSVLFHHSNLRLPVRLDRALSLFVATPRMHAIHHSVLASERDSNWSSLLSLWDHAHGTLRLDVPQDGIRIGLPPLGRTGSRLPRLG